MRAIILAAGFGTRLQPLTLLRAKPAVPFLNRPMITYCVEWLQQAGIDDIVVNLHHLPESVKESVSTCAANIHFSMEEQILGRGGALKKVESLLEDDTFVVCNGKIYLEQELAPVLDFHRQRKALVTMLVVPWRPDSPFNPVLMHPDGRIADFDSGRAPGEWPPGLEPAVFTGVQVVEPEILTRLPQGASDTVGDLYPRLIAEGAAIWACPSASFWCESSTPRRYLENSRQVLRRKAVAGLSASDEVPPIDGCVIGQRCRVEAGSRLSSTVLWDGVTVERGVRLQRTVVTSDATIGCGASISDRVVTPAWDNLAAHANAEVERVDNLLLWPLEAN